jgi:hypothetical protein
MSKGRARVLQYEACAFFFLYPKIQRYHWRTYYNTSRRGTNFALIWKLCLNSPAPDSAVRKAYGMTATEKPLAFLLSLNALVAAAEANGDPVQGAGLPSFINDRRPMSQRIA